MKLKSSKGPRVHITRNGGHPDVPLRSIASHDKRAALYLRVSTEEQTVQSAIESWLPNDPDEDQVVQWWAGHIATWRLALGDTKKAVARDYDQLVAEERTKRKRCAGKAGGL